MVTNFLTSGYADVAGNWDNGLPGPSDEAAFPNITACTVRNPTTWGKLTGTGAATMVVQSTLTVGLCSAIVTVNIQSGGSVIIQGQSWASCILNLNPLSVGTVDVTMDGTGNQDIRNSGTIPSAGPLANLIIRGFTGTLYALLVRLNTSGIDASNVTGRLNLTCGTSGIGKILTVPGGCSVSMPTPPGNLNVDHVDSSAPPGGPVTAPGGTDRGSNVNWLGLLPPGTTHATSGALSGGTGTISGASRRFVSHSTSGALPGGYSEIEGVARRSVRQDVDVRNIEVFDERYNTDCTVVVDGDPSSPVTASDAFSILAGRIVWLKGWDRFFGKQVVDSVGMLALPTPLWSFYAGLPYRCIAETMPVPSAPLQNKKFSNIDVRVNKMRSLRINDSEVVFMNQGSEVDMPPPEFTGHKEVPNLGADKDATIKIVNELPYGGTILAIAGRLEIGES
jgi:hypothetical protein